MYHRQTGLGSQTLPPDLTRQQAAGATCSGPVLVLAGAGTGKTKTLTAAVVHRIAVIGVPASRILAATFTNKAAAEMTSRIQAALGPDGAPRWIGTFHGLAARQLRAEPELAGLRPGFDIVDADDTRRMVKRVMKTMSLLDGEERSAIGRDPLKTMCNLLSKYKDNLVTPASCGAYAEELIGKAHAAGKPIDVPSMRASTTIYRKYQRLLREANAADFGDLLLWPALALQDDPDYRTRWAGRFDCVLADEYQDVNHAQYTWIRWLAAEHRQLFAVGDDDQSVYSWRGADIEHIRRFPQDFPGATQVRLEENFRSTAHILDAANAIIAHDRKRFPKRLFTRMAAGDKLEIVAFRNADAEAVGIAAEILRRRGEGLRWQDIAILYRNNALSRAYEEALMRAHVPYVLIGDVGFYQRAEIKDALALLRLAITPNDKQADEAFRRVINTPVRGFGPKAIDELEAEATFRQCPLLAALETANLPPKARSAGLLFADAIRTVARDTSATVADQLSLVLDAAGYRTLLRDSRAEASEGKLENIQELVQLAATFHSARELLDHAALATGGPADEDSDRVRLMTLHKGKGLEFPHVFLPAWEAGILPSGYGDHAEERRLAYVAITRGMRRVTITHSAYRRGPAAASGFITDVPPANRVMGWLRGPVDDLGGHPAHRLASASADSR